MPTALPFSRTDTTAEFQLNSHCTDTTSFFSQRDFMRKTSVVISSRAASLVRATIRTQVGGCRHRLLRCAHGTLEIQGTLDAPGRRHYGREHSC